MAQDRLSAVEEENRKMRKLRWIVDLTIGVLYQDPHLSVAEARHMVENVRRAALNLFPGKEATFDIVLRPRFERVLKERWGKGLDSRIH